MRIKLFHSLIFVSLCFSACVKDKPNPDIKTIPKETNNGVLVLNEGSYANNNSEISYIDFETQQVSNSIFKTVNGKSLGDVAQSITLIEGKYYIAINNSHKIVIVDTSNFSLLYTIENIKFPRYITQVSEDIAYISSLYFPYVYVLSLSNHTVIDTLITDYPNTEQMLVWNQDVWICNWDTACNYLYKFDKSTHQQKEKVSLKGYAPHDIVLDKNGMLWVLSGNKYKNKMSYLTCINPANNSIEKYFAFDAEADPIRLSMNIGKDTLYFILVNYDAKAGNNGLYRMPIDAIALPASPLIHAVSNSYFWALAINPANSHIFISDPKGFTQSSTIYEYTNDGNLLHSFQTGVGSNQFIFR